MGSPSSLRITRVRRYSGSRPPLSRFDYEILTLSDWASHPIRLCFHVLTSVLTPYVFLHSVWPPPISLATTLGISFDFFSSAYLDVSVQQVPLINLFIQLIIRSSSLRGFPHSEIHGSQPISGSP